MLNSVDRATSDATVSGSSEYSRAIIAMFTAVGIAHARTNDCSASPLRPTRRPTPQATRGNTSTRNTVAVSTGAVRWIFRLVPS